MLSSRTYGILFVSTLWWGQQESENMMWAALRKGAVLSPWVRWLTPPCLPLCTFIQERAELTKHTMSAGKDSSPVKRRFLVWASDPELQRRDELGSVPVVVHPAGHLVPSCCLLQPTPQSCFYNMTVWQTYNARGHPGLPLPAPLFRKCLLNHIVLGFAPLWCHMGHQYLSRKTNSASFRLCLMRQLCGSFIFCLFPNLQKVQ